MNKKFCFLLLFLCIIVCLVACPLNAFADVASGMVTVTGNCGDTTFYYSFSNPAIPTSEIDIIDLSTQELEICDNKIVNLKIVGSLSDFESFDLGNYSVSVSDFCAAFQIDFSEPSSNQSMQVTLSATDDAEAAQAIGLTSGSIQYGYICDTANTSFFVISFNQAAVNNDFQLSLHFSEEQGIFTPTVSVNEADREKGTIKTHFLQEEDNGSLWKVIATPADGYQLAYIQAGSDTSTRVYSDNGVSLQWTVSDNAEYTVYFEAAAPHYSEGSLRYAPRAGASGISVAFRQNDVFVGQRVGFYFTYSLPSRSLPNSTFRFWLYAGQGISGQPLSSYSLTYEASENAGAGKQMRLTVDPYPADLTQVTLAMQLNTGPITTKTFEIAPALSSGQADLRFFTVPEEEYYPSDVRTLQKGPHVYDAAAFIDDNTGMLSLYFAVTGGVMKYDPNAATDLVYMDGMAFPYNDNEPSSGFAFAIGGADEKHLAALVKATAGNFYSGISETYCIYECIDGSWSMVEGSELEQIYSKGLVMSTNDIWVSDQHWDGASWTASGYSFNSFWKENNSSAYAGSDSGLYHYDGSNWSLVSGISGKVSISGAARNEDGSVSIVSANSKRITVTNETANAAVIGGTDNIVSGMDFSTLYIGINEAGELYGIIEGRSYADIGTWGGYTGSYLYKEEDGAWIYQIVDEFNDPNEDDNLNSKIRPDGVKYILNPCEGVSLFLGRAGAIYGEFGSATVTFESNGGSSVAPITQPILSAVSPPPAPEKEGYTFVGWYTLSDSLQNGPAYVWGRMPAKDLTLYAKWVENGAGGDVFATERNNALNSLDAAFNRLTESEYTGEVWGQITAAYEAGAAAIRAATTYNGIYAALNDAVDQINALSQNTNQTITVAVTVEKLTVDGEYIIEPTLVEVKKYTQASVVVTDLLKQKYAGTYDGTPYRITGTVSNSFYLAGIYDPTYVPATSGTDGKNANKEDFDQSYEDFLSELDGGRWSGWMYCVNGKFPGVGASGWTLVDGEVMRWQYSCIGLGCDIGADNSEWGATESAHVADKDALIWKVAEINQAGTKSTYGEAYTNAMTVLKTIEAPQADVDAALAALNAIGGGEAVTAASNANSGSVTAGGKTMKLSANGSAAVTAAVGPGNVVTLTVQAQKTSNGQQVDSTRITLTGIAAYTDGSNTFTVSSTADVPCVILVKNGGNYEKRSVNTVGGVHSVTLAADEEVVVNVKGDATGDGQINAADWSAVIARFKSGSFDGLPAWAPVLYDVTGNGSINAGDWSAMISAFKGITPMSW